MTRTAELTAKLLDGALTDAEALELAALVAGDAVAEAEHVALLQIEAELRGLRTDFDLSDATLARIEDAQADRTADAVMDAIASGPAPAWAIRSAEPAAAAPRRRRSWAVVAAACAASVAVGVWAVLSGPKPHEHPGAAPDAFARLAHKSGAVEVLTPGGEVIPTDEGEELPAGFTVRTGDDSLAVVELLRDNTRVEIEPDSVVRFAADAPVPSAPRLYLAAGQLTAAVPPRPDDRPLIVGTAVADVFARRATFVVSSAGPDSARFDIRDGKVELVRALAPKRVAVSAGGSAVVPPGFDRMDVERSLVTHRLPKRVLAAAATQDAVFSPDGSEVWVGTAKSFGRWTASGSLADVGFFPRKGGAGVARFSGDRRALFTFRGEDDRALVRTIPDGGEQAAVNVRPPAPRFWALAADASWLAVAGEPKPNQKRVRVIDVATGDDRFVREFEDAVGCLTAAPDGRTLAVGLNDSGRGANNRVVIADAATGERLFALPTQKKGVTAMAYSPDGRLLAVGYNGTVQVWDVKSRDLVRAITGFERLPTHLGFSSDGAHLAAGTPDGRVWLWDVRSGRLTQLIEVGVRGVRAIAFSPDGKQLLTVASQVAVWDVIDPPAVAEVQ